MSKKLGPGTLDFSLSEQDQALQALEDSSISDDYAEYHDEEIRTEMIKMFKSQKRHLQTIEALKDQIRKFRKSELKNKAQIDQLENKFKSQRVAYEKRILKIFDENNQDSTEKGKIEMKEKLKLETKLQDLQSELSSMKFALEQKERDFSNFKIESAQAEKKLDMNKNQALELVREAQQKAKIKEGKFIGWQYFTKPQILIDVQISQRIRFEHLAMNSRVKM